MDFEEDNFDGDIEKGGVREPVVAGQFYPFGKQELREKIEQFLLEKNNNDVCERAIVVPHAGYDYSAKVAGVAYSLLRGKTYNTVVIICNSHSDYFNGIAVDDSLAWKTPLGQVEVDYELAESLVNSNEIINFNSEVHSSDHTLEVQIPFLQTVLERGFKIVPIVFGNAENGVHKILSEALDKYLGDQDLLVISTDLSHYPESSVAREVDLKTLELIRKGGINDLDEHIKNTIGRRLPNEQTLCCGIDAVKTLISLAHKKEWNNRRVLKYMNSGELPGGDRARVVGYGAIAFGLIN